MFGLLYDVVKGERPMKSIPVGVVEGDLDKDTARIKLPNNTTYDFEGHEHCVKVELSEENRVDGKRVIKSGVCKISVNGRQVHLFGFSDTNEALITIIARLAAMKLFPFDISAPKNDIELALEGRTIDYRGFGAMLRDYDYSTGNITVSSSFTSPNDSPIYTHIFDKNISW